MAKASHSLDPLSSSILEMTGIAYDGLLRDGRRLQKKRRPLGILLLLRERETVYTQMAASAPHRKARTCVRISCGRLIRSIRDF